MQLTDKNFKDIVINIQQKEGEEIEEQEEDDDEYDVRSMADEGDIGEQ